MNVYKKIILVCKRCLTPRERYNKLVKLQLRSGDDALNKPINAVLDRLRPYAETGVENIYLSLPVYMKGVCELSPLVDTDYASLVDKLIGFCEVRLFDEEDEDDDEEDEGSEGEEHSEAE